MHLNQPSALRRSAHTLILGGALVSAMLAHEAQATIISGSMLSLGPNGRAEAVLGQQLGIYTGDTTTGLESAHIGWYAPLYFSPGRISQSPMALGALMDSSTPTNTGFFGRYFSMMGNVTDDLLPSGIWGFSFTSTNSSLSTLYGWMDVTVTRQSSSGYVVDIRQIAYDDSGAGITVGALAPAVAAPAANPVPEPASGGLVAAALAAAAAWGTGRRRRALRG